MLKSVILRFIRGFVAGGIASVMVAISSGISFHNVGELKSVLLLLAMAFITGGFLATDKAVRMTP